MESSGGEDRAKHQSRTCMIRSWACTIYRQRVCVHVLHVRAMPSIPIDEVVCDEFLNHIGPEIIHRVHIA